MSATAYMINGFDPAGAKGLAQAEQDLIARRARLLGPSYKLFYKHPVHFVRGEGVWLYDPSGEAYLDVYNNVPSVGHCHPRVVEAVTRQAATLNTHTRYLDESILSYSEALLATYPTELSNVMYACTGSEAIDLALRIARHCTGGTGVIVTDNAYHGLTQSAVEVSPSMGPDVPLGQHVITVPAPDAYRAATGEDVGQTFAEHVERAIAFMRRRGIKPAALLLDGILSTDGILSHPAGFLKSAVEAMRRGGGVYIADEVQPGFARTGDAYWGFMRHEVVPDLVVMGKPMGNGMPISGVVAKPELTTRFGEKVRYFNTFGANSVSIAAAQAVLDVIRDEDLMRNSAEVGEYMRQRMREMANEHERIGDVRGAGLFIGLDFVKDRQSKAPDGELGLDVVNRLRDRRVLISASGKTGNVLKIRPPLPFSKANADQFLENLAAVLRECRA